MIIKCKCGRNTSYGLTCTFCRTSMLFTEDAEKDEAALPGEYGEHGFHEVQLDEEGNEILED